MADSDISPELADIHARTQTVYNQHAHGYDARRAKILFERPWLDRFLAKLPASPDVLDVGCGSGDPIDRYLLTQGCNVTGMDNAAAMLKLGLEKFPEASWQHGDMRQLNLKRQFDGVLSWDGFFHLSRQEQAETIPKLANHVRDGGALLLTIGHMDGEVTGTVEGKTVYHSSLSIAAYTDLLKQAGFQTIEHALEDPKCDFHSVILASEKTKNS